jgi:dipeptide/tripeptide permease
MTHLIKIDEKKMDRRKKFPILFINIIVSAIFCVSALYFFVIHYGYSMNPNLSVFGLYTFFFGIVNAIGILISPEFFLPTPRNDERKKDKKKEDLSDFFDSSIVMVLLGIIIIIVVNWYG